MKSKDLTTLLVLAFVVSRCRRRSALPPASTEPFEPEPGPDPLPVIPLPPNPLEQ